MNLELVTVGHVLCETIVFLDGKISVSCAPVLVGGRMMRNAHPICETKLGRLARIALSETKLAILVG